MKRGVWSVVLSLVIAGTSVWAAPESAVGAGLAAPSAVHAGPPEVLVSPDGHLVAVFDPDGIEGGAHAIVLYRDGHPVADLSLEDVLPGHFVATLPRCRCPLGHVSWRPFVAACFVGQRLVLTPHGDPALGVPDLSGLVIELDGAGLHRAEA